MKKTYAILGAVLLCFGCVAGPEDFVQDPPQSDTQMASAQSESDIVTVSNETSAGNFQKSASGLRYRIMDPGTGKKPKATSKVLCHYRGWLDNGQEFDSSYKRGEPTSFPLDGVIPAWTEGVQLIGEGGKIELEVPPKLGYGARGMPPVIPGNARLHFIVELVEVL